MRHPLWVEASLTADVIAAAPILALSMLLAFAPARTACALGMQVHMLHVFLLHPSSGLQMFAVGVWA